MTDDSGMPRHIAVIMDGNGRWAAERGLPRSEGHYNGARRVVDFLGEVHDLNIEYVTLYAFSTENWKRSMEEVETLMDLLARFLDENLALMKERKIRLLATGRWEELPSLCVERLKAAIASTSENYEHTLILALNYGGRMEIVDAVRRLASEMRYGDMDPDDLTEEAISSRLYHPEVPDPDLLIRTSGELRLSNFLLWELSYAEFYFTNTYWPDFDLGELQKALTEYRSRKRRYGGRP